MKSKIAKTLLSVALLLCATSGYAVGYTQHDNFITINVKNQISHGPKIVRLQVIGDKIIRVQSTSESVFKPKQSLIIVPQNAKSNFKVIENDGNVIVTTSCVKAFVDENTGRITFKDAKSKTILAESSIGGKTFSPFVVPEREIGVDSHLTESQKHGVSWHALFDSPADEAFYGLGQHQSEELNMKGKNEDLYQYNTKVSVPFVVSNRNYGLLWDSYSYCRFGNPDGYKQLNNLFTLYDKDGNKGSLTRSWRR